MKMKIYPILNNEWNTLDLKILENGLFWGDTSWNHPNMESPFNRIYFVIDGEAYMENFQGRQNFLPGHMYLIPAGSRYSYACTSVIHKFYLHFNLDLLPGVDLFGRLGTFRQLPYEPELLKDLLDAAQEETISGVLRLKTIVWDVVNRFFQETVKGDEYLESFKGYYRQQEVFQYLSAHLSAGLKIPELAAALNLPAHQLSRSFRQDTGMGLKEYMEQLLQKRARQLLLRTTLPIGEISELLGFSDPFYFSRFFKKFEQLSPREYRKQGF